MKLPSYHDVRIDEQKVRQYLLSPSHPVGRFKAHVFEALGFNEATAELFIEELRRIAATEEVHGVEDTEYGRKYTVAGDLRGPKGRARVLTVWFKAPAETRVRLVSVRPRWS